MNDRHPTDDLTPGVKIKSQNEGTRPSSVQSNESHDADRDQLELVVAHYMEMRRQGKRTNLREFASQYPELTDELHELLPTVDAVEDFSRNFQDTVPLAAGNYSNLKSLGDFRLISEIARGGMGVIYEAEQESLGRRVAIKILMGPLIRRENDLRRFRREALMAAKLHHTNIVPVFGIGEQDNSHYIVMQLIRGVGLDELFAKVREIAMGYGTLTASNATGESTSLARQSLLDEVASSMFQNEWDFAPSSGMMAPKPSGLGTSDYRTMRHATHQLDWGIYFRNIAKIGFQAASALSYAHRHDVLHRDVKPGNILVDAEGGTWIADFGLARALEADDITFPGDIVGTIGYMAPERFEGKLEVSSDVFGLGVALYEMLALVKAYDGGDRISVMYRIAQQNLTPPHKLNAEVPDDLETIVLKAVARNPQDRYFDAKALADDLQRFLNGETILAKRFSRIELMKRWCMRNRMVASLAAAVMVLLGTLFSMTTVGYFRENFLRHRAESTSHLAVSALDEIYENFSANASGLSPAAPVDDDDERSIWVRSQIPLSRDVSTVLENLLHFYDELATHSDQSDELALKSVFATRRIGDIHLRLGDIEKAESSYDSALARISRLDPKLFSTDEAKLEKARILNGRGTILLQRMRHSDAIKSHTVACELLSENSSSLAERVELANSLYMLARATDQTPWRRRIQGFPSRSRGSFEREGIKSPLDRAKVILSNLLEDDPNVPEYKLLLARCLLITRVDKNLDTSESKSPWQSGIDILEELMHSSPDVPDFQYELGDAYVAAEWRRSADTGNRKADETSLLEAEKQLRRGLEATRDLETRNSQIPRFHLLKGRLHYHLALVLEDRLQFDEALTHFNMASERQRDLIQFASPRNVRNDELWLANLKLRSAQVLRDLSRYDESKLLLEENMQDLETLLESPQVQSNGFLKRGGERTLSRVYATLCFVLNKMGKDKEAEFVLRKVEALES